MKKATKAVAGGGTVKFDIPHRVRAVYGRQLGIGGEAGGLDYRLFPFGIRCFGPW
jgi:hypothetical protein